MSCLVGDMLKYTDDGSPVLPFDGESAFTASPYVKAKLSADGEFISVGNESCPETGNTAVITSFEYGFGAGGAGHTCHLEIMDEQGGRFPQFIDSLNKCLSRTDKDYNMKVQWGWIIADCDGGIKRQMSPEITLVALQIEIIYSDGKIKYNITGNDEVQAVFLARHEKIYGTDENKMHLKEAIEKLCNEEDPKMQVELIRFEKDGTPQPLVFEIGGINGPKSVWVCDNQNKAATITRWLEPFRTENKKGFILGWDNTSPTPKLLVMEGLLTKCEEDGDRTRSIGTFIVNGGKCSNVLDFSPKITWLEALVRKERGGGASSGSSETIYKGKRCPDGPDPKEGTSESVIVSQPAWDVYGPKESLLKTEEAQYAQSTTGGRVWPAAIQAELRIVGNPKPQFTDIYRIAGTTCSIIVVNPFHIRNTGEGCGDWLADPLVNEVLSNKRWWPSQVNHHIKDGSYVTTLSVSLPVPNINLSPNSPVGGSGSNGWKPKFVCD